MPTLRTTLSIPFLFALNLVVATSSLTQAAIMTTPGLIGVTFWEATGPVSPYTFAFNSPQMTTQLGVGILGPNTNDFSPLVDENYDVFYSDSNGNFNLNGNYVTVEAVFPHPLPSGGGLNLAAVDLVFGSGTLRADVLASFVGLGNNYIPGSEVFAVDADTAIPSTATTMGSTIIPPTQHMRVTVTWKSLVPEPTSMAMALTGTGLLMFRRKRRGVFALNS
jgi:hypothetical protein